MEATKSKVAGSNVIIILVLASGLAVAQGSVPPPHAEYLSGGITVSGQKMSELHRELWVNDWTQEETDAINDYMCRHVRMREWIESKSEERPFWLGTIFNGGAQWRRCTDMADNGVWECNNPTYPCDHYECNAPESFPSNSYCIEDPCCVCDPRLRIPFPDDAHIPFLDYDAFTALHAFDFNFMTFAEVSPGLLVRKKGVPYYDLIGEQLSFAKDNNQRTAGVHLIQLIPPWMAHELTTPEAMATGLINFIDRTIQDYGEDEMTLDNPVSRWTIAGEAVRLSAPPVVLAAAVDVPSAQELEQWTFAYQVNAEGNCADGDGGDFLGSIPVPAVEIAGESLGGGSIFALVDDEIVEVTSRTQNTLMVKRSRGGTAGAHAQGSVIYTIKDLIWTNRDMSGVAPNESSEMQKAYWPWYRLTD